MRARQNKEMALQNKICVGCSKQFEGRPNAKACSSKCRKRFFRARQAVKQEVEKLAQLRDEIKQDIHGSLSLPQMVPVAADDDTGNSGLENFVDDQPEFMDSLNSSEVVTEAPVEEPIYSQPPIIPLEPLPPAPDKWEQLQNSWQTPPAAPAPAQTAPEQVPAPKTMPVQTLSPLESLPAAAPALLETTPYEAPTLENAPMMPINSLETTTAAPKSPILANWFKNKPFAVTLAFVVLISLASGIFAITGLMRQSPAGEDGLSLQQDTTDDSLLNVKDAKLTLNLDTTIVTKLGIGIVPTGDASLQVTGDIQSTATIFASGGGSSLNNAGLTINNVVVCTAAGCASNVAGATVLLQNAVLGTRQVGNIYISGTVTAGSFSGSGTGLTGVNAAKLEGNTASFFTNASNLSSGTLSDARLSSNVSLLGQTIDSGEILDGTITNIDIAAGAAIAYAKLNLASSIVSADITDGTLVNADIGATAAIDWSKISKAGSSLADLTTRSASDLTSGTLAIARGGTGAGTAQAAIDNLSGLTTTGDLLYYDGANSTRLARGANGNCLQSSAVSIAWVACAGLINLQNAYDNGNTITTSDARNITLTYADTATDSNLTISTATGSTGFTTISRADGAGAADPAQLLLIDNLDLDRAQPIGLKLQSAAGALTTAIDATDDQIVTALAIGSNTITTTSTTIAATELDLLDGRDTQLVDTTDAVVTAIVGTGTLTTGALGAGFTAVAVGQGGTGATTFTANGVLYGNTTAAVGVTAAGTTGQCLSGNTGAAPTWVACTGLITLQNAYDNGNTITTSDARNITLTYADTATDSNLTISTATGSTGFTTISRADGAGAADPAQLLLIDNLDLDRAQPIGLKLQSAAGALTTAIDATDDQIVTALAIGSNTITTTSTTIAATELDLLDGRDTQLVDTTDAVVTAIVGTGTLTTGALGAGFTAVAVGQGGTGATTFTANGVLYGNTTAAVGVTAAGTTGQCLSGNTGAAPTWVACTGLITLQNAYDNDGDGSDSIIAQTSADDGLIFRNPDLGSDSNYILTLDQLATTGTHGGLSIQSAGSGNLLLITDTTATARDVLTIANGGAATFRNQTDSATGFQIQDADGGTPIFNVDTGNEWVGLGTASPGSLLDMVASSTAGILQITNTNTAGYASIDFFNNSDVMQGNVGYANASVASSFLQNSIYFGSNTDIPIVLQTGSTERVRVHAGGNVGIGTSTPTNLLDVAGNTLIGTRGSEKVANGDFSTHAPSNCNGWTLGADWACDIVSNEADNTGAGTTTLEQNVSSVAGETYVVSFTVKNRTAGTVTPQVGGVSGSAVSSNTAASQLIVATGTGNLIFTPNAAFDGSIDDASVKKLTGGDLSVYGNGLFKPATDSTTAFQIQNAAGTSNLLVADTTNTRIGLGTASPTELLTVAGNIKIGKRTDSGGTTSDWSKASQATAGTIAEDGGATSSIDGADVMAVYNGSLYVGSGKEGAAEVYRYDGGTSWTKVSQATAGTIAEDGGATTGIDYVDSMVVYNGYLYIGTYESEGLGDAEVYRYDGGTSWTIVSQATPGTIASGGTADIDGVNTMVVFGGSLYVTTEETDKAEVYRYDGGTSWVKISHATAGTIAEDVGATSAINAVFSATVYANNLYIGTSETAAGEVYRYDGGTSWTDVSTSFSGIDRIASMTVYNGRLYAGAEDAGGAQIYRYDGDVNWTAVNAAAGKVCFSGGCTVNIGGVISMAVYNGWLYVGTFQTDGAEIYRFNENDLDWTKVSQSAAGTIMSSGTTLINRVSTLVPFNGSLYAGTDESTKAEVYAFSGIEGLSFSLKFGAASDNAGATEQSGFPNEGSISFLAEQQANAAFGQGNATGSFLFSNGIVTAFGAYDIAEDYPTRDDSLEAGDVVAIDSNETGFVQKANGIYNSKAVGVYSAKPALRLSQKDTTINGGRVVPVALAGRVEVKVSGENGAIAPGDYLTTSSKPGYAMKATKNGPVIGKALGRFDGETGKVLAFVNISYGGPTNTEVLQGGNEVLTNLVISGELKAASLSVSGNAKFEGDLTLAGHLITEGDAPEIIAEPAAGTGAVATVDGNDQAGTVTLTTGANPTAGALVKITFKKAYGKAPKVVTTPANDKAAAIQYYYESATGEFSIRSVGATDASTIYKYTYLIVE